MQFLVQRDERVEVGRRSMLGVCDGSSAPLRSRQTEQTTGAISQLAALAQIHSGRKALANRSSCTIFCVFILTLSHRARPVISLCAGRALLVVAGAGTVMAVNSIFVPALLLHRSLLFNANSSAESPAAPASGG